MPSPSLLDLLRNKLWGHLSQQRRLQLGALLLAMLTNGLVLIGLLWALLLIDAKVALVAGGVFGLAYAVIVQTSKRQLASNSKRSAVYSQASLQSLQEGLGAIRYVLLDGSQKLYLQIYRQADRPLR